MKILKHQSSQSGIALHEYAVLIGLVGLVSILGLKALGVSTHSLFENSGTALVSNNPANLLTTKDYSSQSTPLKGSGYYAVVVDPQTGKPTIKLVNGVQAAETNVTSVDGSRLNTLGTIMIANKLAQMAAEATDPEAKAYYNQMAKLSFLLGGAEGELDDVPGLGLDPPEFHYTNGSALQDILNYNQQLQALLNNPPASLNPQDLTEVLPLGVNVYNIANNYKNSLQQFIMADGTTVDFLGPNNTSGTGEAGSVLNVTGLSSQVVPYPTVSNETLISYERLKASATEVLENNQVDSLPVESTLRSAVAIDKKAESTP